MPTVSLLRQASSTNPPKKPIEKRTCFHCKQVEDEFHFIFNCPLYNEERTAFATKLASFSILPVTPTTESFILIMSALEGDAEVGLAVCDFINECLLKRTQALSENNEREILLRPEITIMHSGRHSYRPAILDFNIATTFREFVSESAQC